MSKNECIGAGIGALVGAYLGYITGAKLAGMVDDHYIESNGSLDPLENALFYKSDAVKGVFTGIAAAVLGGIGKDVGSLVDLYKERNE